MKRYTDFVVLASLVALLYPAGVFCRAFDSIKGICVPGNQPAISGSIRCNSSDGSCGGPIIEYERLYTCVPYPEATSTCHFRKAKKHEIPAVRTELTGFWTYVYCLGGSAACAACFGAAYAAETATGVIAGLLAGASASETGIVGAAVAAGLAGGAGAGIAYYICHGTCNWACGGMVWNPCCFIKCTEGIEMTFVSEMYTCY